MRRNGNKGSMKLRDYEQNEGKERNLKGKGKEEDFRYVI